MELFEAPWEKTTTGNGPSLLTRKFSKASLVPMVQDSGAHWGSKGTPLSRDVYEAGTAEQPALPSSPSEGSQSSRPRAGYHHPTSTGLFSWSVPSTLMCFVVWPTGNILTGR